MAWKNVIAHKISLGYLKLKYGVPITDLLKDPKIKELPFYNEDASADIRKLDIKVFAGEFVSYLASMQFEFEPGKTLDSAYNDLVGKATKGNNNASTLGDAVNLNFKFIDEE